MTTMRTDRTMSMAPKKGSARSQKGNALVEFALILPMFLLLVFGMISFSIALYNKTVLTIAVREGARAGAKYIVPWTTQAILDRATAACRTVWYGNLITFGTPVDPKITPTLSTANPVAGNTRILVTATYQYTGIFFLFTGYYNNFSLPGTMTIGANNTMLLESL
mgnify:CR=1 FL=1